MKNNKQVFETSAGIARALFLLEGKSIEVDAFFMDSTIDKATIVPNGKAIFIKGDDSQMYIPELDYVKQVTFEKGYTKSLDKMTVHLESATRDMKIDILIKR